jgi:hypothetical protein
LGCLESFRNELRAPFRSQHDSGIHGAELKILHHDPPVRKRGLLNPLGGLTENCWNELLLLRRPKDGIGARVGSAAGSTTGCCVTSGAGLGAWANKAQPPKKPATLLSAIDTRKLVFKCFIYQYLLSD